MRSSLPMFAAALIMAASARTQLNPPPMSPDRGILTENECFLVMPPELIAGPMVTTVSPSGSTRYLLVQRQSMRITSKMLSDPDAMRQGGPPGETSLILWDSETRQAREVWKAPMPETHIVQIEWIPQTDTALIQIRQSMPKDPKDPKQGRVDRNGLLRVTPTMDKAQVVGLTDVGEEGYIDLWVSPNQPVAVLHHRMWSAARAPQPVGAAPEVVRDRETLYLLSETGRLGAHIDVPQGLPFGGIQPGEDGNPVATVYKAIPGKKGMQPQYFAMNPRTAALTPLGKQPQFRGVKVAPPGTDAYPARVRLAQAIAQDGDDNQKVGLLWLESTTKSELPRTLIAADAGAGTLLPRGDVVVYHAQGAVWAAPLLRMDKAQFLAMRDAARRTQVLSNAKQLGLAVLMYTQDYDEVLPTPDGINGKLSPYLKNDALFQGFTYTYGGGAMSGVQSPAETELGFVTGPGGRAVIYVDGHVKWRGEP